MAKGKILNKCETRLAAKLGETPTCKANDQQPQTNLRRRGALLDLAELHGPDKQLGSPDPLNPNYRLPREPPPPLPLRA
jgi:hypothetical protein